MTLECGGRAQRRRRFGLRFLMDQSEIQSSVAVLSVPPAVAGG